MSELEKQQREAYQKNRKKWILIQSIILIVLSTVLLFSSVTFFKLNKDEYVNYTEEGNVIHKAYLSDNEFYSESYLNGSHAYVSSLIEKMSADFSYDLAIDAKKVNFKYSYKIDAQLEIKDKNSDSPIYNPTYEIIPKKTFEAEDNKLSISEHVEFDYKEYNKKANEFVSAYALKNTQNTLILRMYVDVVGMSEEFAADTSGEYVVEMYVPLMSDTVKPQTATTVPAGAQRILATDSNAKTVFFIISVVIGALDVIGAVILAVFVMITVDKHIDYSRRVQKLITSYKSYIQRIITPFDSEGYRILYLSTFTEMLEVRDTIQQPILMYENEDKTCSQFMIPTDTNILYMFNVEVEDDEETAAEETVCEEPIVEEPVAEEPIVEEKIEVIAEPEPFGVEVIDVMWPEHENKDKVYMYDPDGEVVDKGDVVLVPSIDKESKKEIVREATVTKGNYREDPAKFKYPLKKIIKVVRRKLEDYLKQE